MIAIPTLRVMRVYAVFLKSLMDKVPFRLESIVPPDRTRFVYHITSIGTRSCGLVHIDTLSILLISPVKLGS